MYPVSISDEAEFVNGSDLLEVALIAPLHELMREIDSKLTNVLGLFIAAKMNQDLDSEDIYGLLYNLPLEPEEFLHSFCSERLPTLYNSETYDRVYSDLANNISSRLMRQWGNIILVQGDPPLKVVHDSMRQDLHLSSGY